MTELLPGLDREWLAAIVQLAQGLAILLAAWALQRVLRYLIRRLKERQKLPPELLVAARRISAFLIYSGAILLILERAGVSGTVLWTAFTGFAAVAAVAFFAAWSVLSNIFCAVLILTTRPFRLYDHIELVENGEKTGLKGRVVDINLIYTTLQEVEDDERAAGNVLQIPNNLFFQRIVRRSRGGAR
jgi:small-conductance mechanosensitive channel